MDRLWAPWRMKYIKVPASATRIGGCADIYGAKICGGKKQKKCLFCQSLKTKRKNYVIFKGRHSFSMLNIFPYNNGHVMVSPIRHIQEFSQLKDIEILDLFKTLNDTKKMLDKVLKPHGYNIGINISASAGAGETRHLHIHIVPRWRGDTNFMTVLSDTKIISQSLDELYRQLRNVVNTDKHG